jgi:hypothetical protein
VSLPIAGQGAKWSIGIYTGAVPFKFASPARVENPVLSYQSVTDVHADFVADPFMIRRDGVWLMFFEVMDAETGIGKIALATSADGLRWNYERVVLEEPFHLSYPYVFEWRGEYYMTPETLYPGAIQLYKAAPFPFSWIHAGAIIDGAHADPSPFHFAGRWWMFACSTPNTHDTLRLYFADDVLGQWHEHPVSPIVEHNRHVARPAGRVLVWGERVIRFAQDCDPYYGTRVRAFEVVELTPTNYSEKEHEQSPVLNPVGKGWNGQRMHHLDPHLLPSGEWLACVDGKSF